MKKLTIILGVTALLTGCTVLQGTTSYAYQESSVRILEPEQSMLLSPVMADLEVSEHKVSHTEKDAFADIIITPQIITDISEFKKIALSRAAKVHNADVLVGTIIDVVTKNNRLEITVSGYPAYYRNFRSATAADAELVRAALSVKNRNLEADIVALPENSVDRNVNK